jgi:SSS family solute:Na+ symporter/sodium/pantothenate symporter
VNDIVKPFAGESSNGLVLSRWVLVIVGVFGVLLAWNPPPLIGLFAQKGVYGLAAASLVPVLFGVLLQRHIPLWIVMGAAGIGLGLHLFFNLAMGIANPAISASYGILASLVFALLGLAITRGDARRHGSNP